MESANTLDTQALKGIIKESIREVLPEILGELLREERLKLCKMLIPTVSDEEQEEINQELGSPNDFDEEEFVNLTEWTEHGSQLQ
ncbi:MAG: hypothetical protein WBA57_18195 [Elainellaceae cyanobacterium]